MESVKTSITAIATQQDRETEEQVFQICARAGVSCIGIQRGFGLAPDHVLFQPVVTTLAVPLSTFANPDEAIAAIKAKLVQAGGEMTRAQRARVAAAAIAPVTVAGVALIRCGCSMMAWMVLAFTAVVFGFWAISTR